MARKSAKAKLDEFENLMIGGIIALGASELDDCSAYDWELMTLHGKLLVSIEPNLFGIQTRFDIIPDIKILGGVRINPYSGKWNHYRIEIQIPRVAAGQLIDELSQVVSGVRASHRAHSSSV